MMKCATIFFLSLSVSINAHCDAKTWQEKMREISIAMGEVIPFLYPTPDKDIKGLTDKVGKLHDLTQELDVKTDHMIQTRDFDPALIYLSYAFKEDIDRAYRSLRDGHTDYARYVLRDSTSYCIGCHTRMASGAQFPLLKSFAEPLKHAPWIARMEFLAASRQFDAAFAEIMGELKKPSGGPLSSLDLERGVRMALSIAIRVKQQPALALKLVRAVTRSKQSNPSMKLGAKDWERDILAWQKEKTKTYSTPDEMLKEAKRFIDRAEKSRAGGHDEVNYLRATAVLHDLLRKFSDSREAGEALYLIGVSYRTLQELGFWNIQEKYFRACILAVPHTELAEKCYKELEESIIFGYSGSSGTHVPPELQFHLKQLKNKAQKSKEEL